MTDVKNLTASFYSALVQNETISFKFYFDVSIAIKVIYFVPTYISGIKSVLKISGVFPLSITLARNLEAVFWGKPFFSKYKIADNYQNNAIYLVIL